MKIDIVIAVAQCGGVENVINETASYLQKQGWRIRVVQLIWEGVNWLNRSVSFYPLLFGKDNHDLEELVKAYGDFIKKEGEPDAVLATAWPYISFITKTVLQNTDTIPVISWLHAPVEEYAAAGFGGYESLQWADFHFAISDYIYKKLKCNNLPKIYRVYNPVSFFKTDSKYFKTDKQNKKLFYIGRISPEKRIEVILKALTLSTESWNFYIVGEGEKEYVQTLQDEVFRLRLSNRVSWMGWQENPWKCAKSADAIVLASEYEGMPLVLIEALACGKTVISTPTPGAIELIMPGKTGYLFGYNDYEMLAEILNALQQGQLPFMDGEHCKKYVMKYESNTALKDFEQKVCLCLCLK